MVRCGRQEREGEETDVGELHVKSVAEKRKKKRKGGPSFDPQQQKEIPQPT